jgi:hypothetical protein
VLVLERDVEPLGRVGLVPRRAMKLELVACRELLLGRRTAPVVEHSTAEVDGSAPLGFVGMAKPRDVKREHALARVSGRGPRSINVASIPVVHGLASKGGSAAAQRSSFCSKRKLAYAGLVDGNTCVASDA